MKCKDKHFTVQDLKCLKTNIMLINRYIIVLPLSCAAHASLLGLSTTENGQIQVLFRALERFSSTFHVVKFKYFSRP